MIDELKEGGDYSLETTGAEEEVVEVSCISSPWK